MTKVTETKVAAQTNVKKFAFAVVRNLTLPLLKLTDEAPAYIRIDEPLKLGKKVDAVKDPAIVTTVTNLETGEVLQMLVPAVMQGILHDDFGAGRWGRVDPKDKGTDVVELVAPAAEQPYVGKAFSIIMHAKANGKAYKGCSIAEIEVTEG